MENKKLRKEKVLVSECDYCGKIKKIKKYDKLNYCDKCASKLNLNENSD